jgi:two-component system, OmpR family, sensor histidine kinase KdpD
MKKEPLRPDPDTILAQIQAKEQQNAQGRLKIFVGYAAGVGKTYAMLEAAHQRKEEGVDVVIGYVETHGRAETEARVSGLEVLQRKAISYRGVILTELDTDSVIARRPQLVLVDELAHTNAPGSRHLKRYQDVEEILASGIDVYTTLNIQHLESLNDVISQITDITVRETVPDRVIDKASEIELVDLPPDELLNRLKEGKVYVPEQARRAIQSFFRKGNLTALRELSMRRAAERVDDQMRDYMQIKAIPGPWPATERLMVCISSNPLAERLVRSTRRLADELNAEWLAVYIETPGHGRISQEQRTRITKTLLLAEELGGRSMTLSGHSVPDVALNYAREHNVTKVIVGKPVQPRWREILFGSLVDQLVRSSGNIDVYIISGDNEPESTPKDSLPRPAWPWRRYTLGILLVLVAFGISALIQSLISPTNLVMVFLLAVITTATFLGRGPSILVSFISVLVFDFFFVPPFLTFAVADSEYILTFIGLFGVGLVISELTARVRDQAEVAQRREAETATLYSLSRDLSVAEGLEEIIRSVTVNIGQTFGREVVIFLPEQDENEKLRPYTPNANFDLDENELAVAIWSFQHGQPAGRGTDTLAASDARYIPLKTSKGVVGVLGIKPKKTSDRLTTDQNRLLETLASQAALAIERARLAEQAQYAQLLQAAERLQTALLNSISHDLRTPLVSVTGALSSLVEGGPAMDAEIRQSLAETALEEADRMNRLVGNLLNMTRLEAGALQVVKQPGDIQDAIGTALENLEKRVAGRQIVVRVPEDVPLTPMDFVLIVQVLVNLIDNSLKYSPVEAQIEIQARAINGAIQVQVSDRGMGIPPSDLEHIFDKFYRVQRPAQNIGGTGLGLSISKGIVEAHGGRIWAENRPRGGTIISFTLPLDKTTDEKQ